MSKNMENKYKLSKRKKAGAIIGALIIAATGGAVKLTSNVIPNDTTQNSTEIVLSSNYIDVEKNDELRIYDTDKQTTTIKINNHEHLNFSDQLTKYEYSFEFAQYYGLDKALERYNNTTTKKTTESTILNENGLLDADKLLNIVKKNNEEYMSGGVDAINTFYSETNPSDMKKICDIIAEVINTQVNDTDIKHMANTLSKLTIFNRTGSASNAYITSDLTFVYNPNMSGMYAEMQEITGTQKNKDETIKGVIVHEIMHLLQYENNDHDKENGLEIGICRMYNMPNAQKNIPVDALYYPWLLEASAEMEMSEYLKIPTGTYDKKISYAKSYNLSCFNKLDQEHQALQNIAFNNTLEDAYSNLELNTEKEKREFLELMFSIEITQSDPKDFWENYTQLTGKIPTEEEKLDIRKSIREEVVKYMSKNFYQNLSDTINEGKITDLDSAFYLMRIWEIDSYKHLDYTKEENIEYAKEFILWQDNVQNDLFTAIANSSDLSLEEIKKQYEEYNIQTNIDETIEDNCNFNKLNAYVQNNILTAKEDYATSNFARNSDMAKYIQNNQEATSQQESTK